MILYIHLKPKAAYSKTNNEEIKVLLDDLAVKTRALSSKDAKNSRSL